MRHIHLGVGHPGRTQDAIVAALKDMDGFVLTAVTLNTKNRTREVDAVVICPQGVWTVEGKGTRQTGTVAVHARKPWLVDGQEAHFAGGPNPVQQAREGAQILAAVASQAHLHPGFIPAVVAVSGPVALPPTRLGDTVCVDTTRLSEVFSGPARLPRQEAAQLLALLTEEGSVKEEELSTFPDTASRAPKQLKNQTRFLQAAERAQDTWRKSNSRRVWFSAAGGAAGIVFIALDWEPYSLMAGVAAYALSLLITWWMRSRRAGPRKSGAKSLVGWAISNLPYMGAAALLVSGWISDDATGVAETLYMQLTTLLTLGVLSTTLAGRSWVVYPPPMVVQQLDRNGKPTGAYFLVEPPAGKAAHSFTLEEAVDDPGEVGLLDRSLTSLPR